MDVGLLRDGEPAGALAYIENGVHFFLLVEFLGLLGGNTRSVLVVAIHEDNGLAENLSSEVLDRHIHGIDVRLGNCSVDMGLVGKNGHPHGLFLGF